jgi:N-acyl-D-aspartate/D-glutamate deacylase
MIDHNVFLTSTLSIFETSIPSRAIADNRSLKLMSPSLLSQYGERRKQFNELLDEGEQRENRLKRIMAFELQFFRMGGTLTAGSDPGRHNLPGYGDQRNFELLIEAGFNLQEAVMIVTTNGAKVLERSDIGTIKNGKRADFVILNGDLGKDPRVIRQVEAVFKEGIGYDPNSLLKGMEGKVGQ